MKNDGLFTNKDLALTFLISLSATYVFAIAGPVVVIMMGGPITFGFLTGCVVSGIVVFSDIAMRFSESCKRMEKAIAQEKSQPGKAFLSISNNPNIELRSRSAEFFKSIGTMAIKSIVISAAIGIVLGAPILLTSFVGASLGTIAAATIGIIKLVKEHINLERSYTEVIQTKLQNLRQEKSQIVEQVVLGKLVSENKVTLVSPEVFQGRKPKILASKKVLLKREIRYLKSKLRELPPLDDLKKSHTLSTQDLTMDIAAQTKAENVTDATVQYRPNPTPAPHRLFNLKNDAAAESQNSTNKMMQRQPVAVQFWSPGCSVASNVTEEDTVDHSKYQPRVRGYI